MSRFNTLVFAGLLTALPGALPATAQTSSVARLTVQSGNGQVACRCIAATLQNFQPISVKATDSSGNPVAGATVTWAKADTQPVTGVGIADVILGSATSITGGDGIATNTIDVIIFNNFSSTSVTYLVGNISASANNQSVVFTETQSLITDQGGSVIQAQSPTYNGANLTETTLSANVGTTLATPIKVQVAGLNLASNGVGNVSVRIVNLQASPTLSCAYFGGYADPGSALSDPQGNVSCFPVFSGSGSGKFRILIGGVPVAAGGSALYLQEYPGESDIPYNFTSIAGAPTALRIVSGNNQVGTVGAALNLLVAKLVDINGNAVQGRDVVWSVLPAGAVALTNTLTTTDNNGQVSTSATLFLPASAGTQITVALANNPNISVTFQETLAGAITTLTKIRGDNQTTQTATNFATQIVVQVNGASGPVKNYPVQFLVNGPVTLLEGTTVATDTNGQAAVTVKAGSSTGSATVTAVVGILNQVFNLTITSQPNAPPPNGMTLVSGNPQSAIIGATFAPLVVQVNSTAGPVAGVVVNFSTTGPISLSTAAVTTASNGQAQVTVQAGNLPGPASVTAAIPGFSQAFNLTVLPQGPSVTPNSFLNAASRQVGSLSPCSLVTLSAVGLTPDGIAALSPAPIFGRLPLSVHNLSVTFGSTSAPIVSVAQGATNPEVTMQVPCDVQPGNANVTVNVGQGVANTTVAVQTVSPGIFETAMSDGAKRAVVVRDDGTFADIGTAFPNPARRGENVRIYVTGLGPSIPSVGTNQIQNPNADLIGRDAIVAGTVQVGLSGVGGVQVVSARQAPNLIGVYEIQFTVPSNAPTGNDVVISVGVIPAGASSGTPAVQSQGSKIPIQ